MAANRVQQLEDLAASVRSGTFSREYFAEAMAEIGQELQDLERELDEAGMPAESEEALRADLALGRQGLARLRCGVGEMARYAQDSSEESLEAALGLVRQGVAELTQAARVLKRDREELERRRRG